MFGEAVPYHSGLTCLIKGHGHFNPISAYGINKRDQITSRQHFIKELEIVNGIAVLLIRNPYNVIYSYRNYIDKGMAGHSDESKFFGPGLSWLQIDISIDQNFNVAIFQLLQL